MHRREETASTHTHTNTPLDFRVHLPFALVFFGEHFRDFDPKIVVVVVCLRNFA